MDSVGKIYITSAMIEKLGIPISAEIPVRAGVKTALSRLYVKKSELDGYWLSSQLVSALNLSYVKRLQIRYDHDHKMIHIGPIIGIMTDILPNRREYSPKGVQAELIYLSDIGRILPGQYYIFTPDSIDWTNQTVRGYVYHNQNRYHGNWLSSEYPFPDVVYDRVSTRRGEALDRVRYAKKRLMDMPFLHYFNPAFLNKWKVHGFLTVNDKLTPYLPETRLLNLFNLTDMIARYETLYLKPCNGSLGKGIIKVYNNNGGLRYTIYKMGKHYADNCKQLLANTSYIRKGRPYIVQEGINLQTYQYSAFDIRIIYQKNGDGEWVISKKFVRVAPRGSSIANLSRGGRAVTSKEVFAAIFSQDDQLINAKNQELKNLCKIVAETLEAASQNNYGELGLDVGIDKQGKYWLIEVNSKPRKTTQTELSQGIVRNTFKRPLQYAKYLAGFNEL